MRDREVVVQAKTVEDARLAAAKLLQVEGDRLQVQVIDEGRRGLFGLFGRPVTIRVTVRPRQSGARWNRDDEPDEEGTAEVAGGVLRVRGPRGKARAATVIPALGAVLRVNGAVIHGPRPVREDEDVDVEPVEEVHPARVEIELSSDGLTATAKVTPRVTVRHELVDQSAQNVLQLLTRRHEEQAKVITAAEVQAALLGKGVVLGLDYEEIARAVDAADGVERVVARGEPVREGRNGFVEYLFDRKPIEIVYEGDEKADYWERYVFPSVKEGDVLAVVHPSVPGAPGRKVTGEAILPPPVREASLRAKSGVNISEDGRKAVAAIAGRPVLEGYREPFLNVIQLMVHPGDVDLRSGNLRFSGDLLILGSVTEGMRVSSYGDITVMGSVSGAVVQAGGRLVCRGSLIGSRVQAGGLRSLYARLVPLLNDVDKILEGIIRETTRIKEHPANRRRLRKGDINRVVRLLVERHKQDIDAIANKYASVLEEVDMPFPPAVRELAADIRNLTVSPVGGEGPIPDDLESIKRRKREVEHLLDALPEHPGDILCSYAQNSAIDAGGDIIVADEGCFHSTLTAGKRVRVRGVFRGGEIAASGNVFVGEAGSPGPSVGKVRIRTSQGNTVTIGRVHPETAVQVGNRSYVFDKEENRVKVALGQRGTLSIETRGHSGHRLPPIP